MTADPPPIRVEHGPGFLVLTPDCPCRKGYVYVPDAAEQFATVLTEQAAEARQAHERSVRAIPPLEA